MCCSHCVAHPPPPPPPLPPLHIIVVTCRSDLTPQYTYKEKYRLLTSSRYDILPYNGNLIASTKPLLSCVIPTFAPSCNTHDVCPIA